MPWTHHTRTPAAPAAAVPLSDLELRTQAIGRELLAATRHSSASAFSKKFWSDRLISWALQDDAFKVQLFRFIDVFPVLKTPAAIHEHLLEYLGQPGVKLPAGMAMGIKAGELFKAAFARTISSQIEAMGGTFIAGRNVAAALPALEDRWRQGVAFSVDLLGEACVSQTEAEAYRARYLELIERLAAAAEKWPGDARLEGDHLGPVPRVNVSVKISALDGHVKPLDQAGSVERLAKSLRPILTLAREKHVFINFDMEHHAIKELTIALFKRCCEEFDFPDGMAGLALQAYLRSAEEDVQGLIDWARAARRVVSVRLIKGAYWDYETIHAQIMGWPSPVWQEKSQTDACFERATEMLIRQMPRSADEAARSGGVKVALGTHNVRSVAHAMAALEAARLPNNAIEFQALRGMAEELKLALADSGWRVREYVPVGEMIPGMAYLVRRLLENTSNEGWLRTGQEQGRSDEQLLAPPKKSQHAIQDTNGGPDGSRVSDLRSATSDLRSEGPDLRVDGFRNEPLRDFSSTAVRDRFRAAIEHAAAPRVANDTTVEGARAAIGETAGAFRAWRDLPQEKRSWLILRAAGMIRERRDELAGVIIKESAKTWDEADADVCEAIDFCEYYARQAIDLFAPRRLGRFAGEWNEEFHQPRGVAAVISPWNFPLSICTGMTVAALVTGNTVVLKPAEQTPAIASILCGILWKAGVPENVLRFIPGFGETVGAAIVRDPRVALIAFTGSKAVGLDIVRAAAQTPGEQGWVKRAICEMGGKNAIIVDQSADLDEAVLGVRQSAFGYAGQKCSAASRVVVLDAIHDAFVGRLVESARALVLGDPMDPATDLGPVIDEEAGEEIWRSIEIGKQEATLVLPDASEIETRKSKVETSRWIGPHIFTGVRPEHRIAREEIFGPVLAVLRARDFDEALRIANDSAYKLTGGLFSRTPSHLTRTRAEFRVGNLYINRGITGALVARQPFGGFGLSGAGSKAGGPHYLLQFTDPRVVTENTMRRGFAPGKTA